MERTYFDDDHTRPRPASATSIAANYTEQRDGYEQEAFPGSFDKVGDGGGSNAGYRAYTLRFPSERFSVVCLCNASNTAPWSTAFRVADLYLRDRFDESLREYAGVYHNEEIPARYVILVKDGTLVVRYRRGDVVLASDGVGTSDGVGSFSSPDFVFRNIRFTRDRQGKIDGLLLDVPGDRILNLRFVRR